MTAVDLVKASFSHGWSVFKKRPWLMIGAVVIMIVISTISGAVTQSISDQAVSVYAITIASAFDFFVVQMLISMGFIAFTIKASDHPEMAHVSNLWAPHSYFKYLGTSILVTIIFIIGLVLFVIPGIIAAVLLIFAPYLVMDRNEGPITAIKQSFHAVTGHFWGVLLLIIASIVVNIVGVLLIGIGLLVSIPVTLLAMAHAYRLVLGQVPQVMQPPQPSMGASV
jgi:uncharacterized membrane protein